MITIICMYIWNKKQSWVKKNMDLHEIILAGDCHSDKSSVGVKLLLGLPGRSMLPFVFTWSPWWYWVPSVWFCRVYCFLNCLLGWKLSIAVTLDLPIYIKCVAGSHFVNTLHVISISIRALPTGMLQIYHLDCMYVVLHVYNVYLYLAVCIACISLHTKNHFSDLN